MHYIYFRFVLPFFARLSRDLIFPYVHASVTGGSVWAPPLLRACRLTAQKASCHLLNQLRLIQSAVLSHSCKENEEF